MIRSGMEVTNDLEDNIDVGDFDSDGGFDSDGDEGDSNSNPMTWYHASDH